MLKLQFSAEQSASNPDLIVIQDVAVPGGWGEPNLSRANLAYVIFRLVTPGGRRYSTAPIVWKSGSYNLFAHYFAPDTVVVDPCGCRKNAPCGCSASGVFSFVDGQYALSYEVWATDHIPAQSFSYNLLLMLNSDQQVWVNKNGAWLDATDLGSYNDAGLWVWNVFDTTDVYTIYEVRRYSFDPAYYETCESGQILTVTGPSPDQPTQTLSVPAIVAGVTNNILLVQRLARRLALVTKNLLVTPPCFSQPYSTYTELEVVVALYTAQQLLDNLISTGRGTSQFIGQAVADITQRVDYLETTASYVR